MKRTFNKISRLAIALIATTSIFASCAKDEAEGTNNSQVEASQTSADVMNLDVPDFKIVETEHLTAEQFADVMYGTSKATRGLGGEDSRLDELNQQAKQEFIDGCRQFEQKYKSSYGTFTTIFERAKFTYTSKDENGEPITLSAHIAWGQYLSLTGYKNLQQAHVRLICPFTHAKAVEAPSLNDGGNESYLSRYANIIIIPDGEGFGDSSDRDQLYLNHEVQARQLYDALEAGYYIAVVKNKVPLKANWTTQVCGESQGAGDAIAVHRLLDTEKDKDGTPLNDKWRFEYSNVCCGPYSPSATMTSYYEAGEVAYPCVIPITIKSMLASHPELRNTFHEEQFYSDEYKQHITELDKVVKNKELDARSLGRYMAKVITGSENLPMKLDKIVSKEFLDPNSTMHKMFMTCLAKHDLTTGWTPKTPSYIYYSKADDVVPYVNTQKLMDLFQEDPSYYKNLNITGNVDHLWACILWTARPQ